MKDEQKFVGLDVSKGTIAVAIADPGMVNLDFMELFKINQKKFGNK